MFASRGVSASTGAGSRSLRVEQELSFSDTREANPQVSTIDLTQLHASARGCAHRSPVMGAERAASASALCAGVFVLVNDRIARSS
jgi:hypothetical protein